MQHIINIVILILLAVIVFQDFKMRLIHWGLIPLLLLAFLAKGLFLISLKEMTFYSSFNLLFVFLEIAGAILFVSIKHKKFINILDTYIGIGDILLFIILCVAFSTFNFIAFFLLSLLFIVISFIIYRMAVKGSSAQTSIPTAGIVAGLLGLLILVNYWIPGFSFYNDGYLLSMINI